MLSLVLFCDARTYKNRFCAGYTALYIKAMGLHRRKNIGQKIQLAREIFLNKKIDRMTAGGNNYISAFLVDHALILVFYYGRTDGRFFNVVKSELF